MERKPVTQGRNIKSAGYDAASQTLEIEFSSGGIYSYAAVPPEVHDKLIHAESPGGYFAAFIRPSYEFVHLNPVPKDCICDPNRRTDQIRINPYCKAKHAGEGEEVNAQDSREAPQTARPTKKK